MRRALQRVLLLSALCAAGEASAQIQAAPPVPIGSRMRVTVGEHGASRTVIGGLVEWGPDTIGLAAPNGSEWRIATGTVTRVDVSRGKGVVASHVLVGAGVGVVTGTLVGGVVANNSSRGSWIAPIQTVGGMLAGAVVGGAGGALVGMMIPGEKWRRVSLQHPALSIVPGPHGVSVFYAVRF